MSTYVPSYKGYIADVPEFWFKRCSDGYVYHDDKLTSCAFDPSFDSAEVNAGWSQYAVTHLPTSGALNIQITTQQFNQELFAAMNNTVAQRDSTYDIPAELSCEAVTFDVSDYRVDLGELGVGVLGNLILGRSWADEESTWEGPIKRFDVLIPRNIDWDKATVYFGDTIIVNPETKPDEDEYVEIAPNTYLGYNFTILPTQQDYLDQFSEAFANWEDYDYEFDGDVLSVDVYGFGISEPYCYVQYSGTSEDMMAMNISNVSTAIGEVVLRWPVYASADDCAYSGIKGYVVVKIYKCKVTNTPGFDATYKDLGEFSVELSGMDAKRSDRAVWNMAYFPAESLEPETYGDDDYEEDWVIEEPDPSSGTVEVDITTGDPWADVPPPHEYTDP